MKISNTLSLWRSKEISRVIFTSPSYNTVFSHFIGVFYTTNYTKLLRTCLPTRSQHVSWHRMPISSIISTIKLIFFCIKQCNTTMSTITTIATTTLTTVLITMALIACRTSQSRMILRYWSRNIKQTYHTWGGSLDWRSPSVTQLDCQGPKYSKNQKITSTSKL